jgi:uncharacterized membrane protein YgdD (TMEM256/DUF423 family)
MQRSVWHVAAALSGASGVGAAAYGAHALPKLIAADEAAEAAATRPPPPPRTAAAQAEAVWPPPKERVGREGRELCFLRANQQQMYHALLMAAAPLSRRPAAVGGLALAGTLSFCGSVYAVALTGERSRGVAAPAGGFMLMGAWLALML